MDAPKDTQEVPKPKMSSLMLVSSKGVMGGMMGWISGRFVKQISDMAIFYAGLGLFLIGGLTWMHWITINWAEIDEDLLGLYVKAKTVAQDKGLFARMKRFMTRTAPMLIGFGTGFRMAFLGSD
jgi:uncharacterized membrane protein (Fun14 family)